MPRGGRSLESATRHAPTSIEGSRQRARRGNRWAITVAFRKRVPPGKPLYSARPRSRPRASEQRLRLGRRLRSCKGSDGLPSAVAGIEAQADVCSAVLPSPTAVAVRGSEDTATQCLLETAMGKLQSMRVLLQQAQEFSNLLLEATVQKVVHIK